jgi:curli biogenesis system outer membrane secretion channel CsgG
MTRNFLLAGLALSLFNPILIAAAQKKRVAVLDFDYATVQRWWEGNWDIGAGVSDLVVKELVRDGRYSVIERRALESVLNEQNFSNSDRANASTAAQIGNVLGVDAIILGSITQFGTENKKTGVGGFLGRVGGFGAGKVGTSSGKAKVAIDARVINVNTGEIVAVADGTGESKRSGLMLGGIGGGGGGFGGGSIDMSSSNFRETILGEAVHEAVGDLSTELLEADAKIPQIERKVKGLVAFVDGGLVIINIGSNDGVEPGMELSVERVKASITDPATGKLLREITDRIGTVRVTKVDATSAEATVVSGSDFQVKDVVSN